MKPMDKGPEGHIYQAPPGSIQAFINQIRVRFCQPYGCRIRQEIGSKGHLKEASRLIPNN